MTISLLIIACNDARRLEECVARGRVWASEVVVVAQESEDDTLEVARRTADRVLEAPCQQTSEPSRAPGLAACRGEWVLNLDCDEALTPEAVAGLATKCADPVAGAYRLRRLTTIDGHTFEDLSHLRLFRKWAAVPTVGLHRQWDSKRGARVRTWDDTVVIEHYKTTAEQSADDRRYARIAETS